MSEVINLNPVNYNDFITTNFYYGEFWCKCWRCRGKVPPSEVQKRNIVSVALQAQKHRDNINSPEYPYRRINNNKDIGIRVASGLRCPANNDAVGEAQDSQHLTGNAYDPQPVGKISLWDFFCHGLKHTDFKGAGYGNGKCHFDLGDERYWQY